jgi:diguanylate cyclase (GGDEF)-like protein
LKAVGDVSSSDDPLLASYAQLASGLIGGITGVALFGGDLRSRGHTQDIHKQSLTRWLESLDWTHDGARVPSAACLTRGQWITAIPLEQSDGRLLGVFCAQQTLSAAPTKPLTYAMEIRSGLKPLLDCVHRELIASTPIRTRMQTLTERTAELEWLFKITSSNRTSGDDRHVLENLIDAATQRLQSGLGVIYIPGRRLCVERLQDTQHAAELQKAWASTKAHVLAWAQRHNRPLVVSGDKTGKQARCKLLAVPVARESGGQVIGVLGFYNIATASNYSAKHIFLARHLGRQSATIVDSQFDLMTGLYTRGGLEQSFGQSSGADAAEQCVIYLDVDHMQLVNELHGFELGNELIVRIADLLAPPMLPEGALAARIAADRFAAVLPHSNTQRAAEIANEICAAAKRLKIVPADNFVDVSLSCGIAAFVPMPQGLDRALAMAELACKAAKTHGRNRVEVYACDDNSMIRRHQDVVAIGQLRSALKADRLVLYAQRIVPLSSKTLPAGYEILVRMIDEAGELVLPGPLIQAAHRYQLLPSIDRWVTHRALEMLAPYRSVLGSSGISFSLNVSGQSMCDEIFAAQLAQQIKLARLPADCITVEITEQSAVTNLARANELIGQLRALGCQIALDDFGTGANSLTYLKNLQVSRVKIDGSFVRDVATDRNSRATVRAIVELASGMSIDTVAEYVETKAIADEVRALGVDYAQGFAFGKPEPLDAILAALGSEESQRLHRLFLES